MMHFIRIFCQFLSAPLRPVTAWLKAQLLTPDKQLACIVLPPIFLHLQSLCFFLRWEFNYPGCCCMMLSWHLVTDSLSQLLVWQHRINAAIVSSFLQLCFVLDLGQGTPLAISGRMRCLLKTDQVILWISRSQQWCGFNRWVREFFYVQNCNNGTLRCQWKLYTNVFVHYFHFYFRFVGEKKVAIP